jgi:type I restriction enzyme M protein
MMPGQKLDLTTLENWLWEAACKIRGPVDTPKFKDYILPLIFLKRLSDVFEDEINYLAGEFGSVELAWKLVEEAYQHEQSIVRFYLPPEVRWNEKRRRLLTEAINEYLREIGTDCFNV